MANPPINEDSAFSGGIQSSFMDELWIDGATSTPQGKVCKLNALSAWICWSSSTT